MLKHIFDFSFRMTLHEMIDAPSSLSERTVQ